MTNGTTINPGLTEPDVWTTMKDVSTTWSQAGITFHVEQVSFVPVSDHFLQVVHADDVTDVFYTEGPIDLIFIHSFTEHDVAGETYLPDPPGPDWHEPGCVIAGRCSEFIPIEAVARMRFLTRTVAHELGHYVMNKGNSAHNVPENYVMRGGASQTKREISKSEADTVRSSGVTPWNTNP
ncbi:hypothetical protein HQ563_06925 [bacterium]|nr:hypothetical protein [bacterium]